MDVNTNHNGAEKEKNNKFPFKIEKFDDATLDKISTFCSGDSKGHFKIGPINFVMPSGFVEHDLDELYNFEARPDDVYVCTYPRSGTTWMQEMIWLICNDLNYEAAKAKVLKERFPYFELHTLFPKNMQRFILPPVIDILSKMTSPRFIKTHIPVSYLPPSVMEKGSKIIYVARNPKDVAVSYYHFHKDMFNLKFTGDFELFVDCMMKDLLIYDPYFEHIKDGWNHRHDKNVLFLFYEDLVMNLSASLQKLANFLERPLKDDDLAALMHHLNVKNFKQNPSVNTIKMMDTNNFIRRGLVGGNPEMTTSIAEKIDEWTEKQLMGSDLKFPYELRHKMEMFKLNANRKFEK